MGQLYNESNYFIAVFNSRNHAIQLYQLLKKSKFNQFQLISTPCRIKSGCSYSIKCLKEKDVLILKEQADKINKNISIIYEVRRINGRKTFTKVNML
ncbi:DUF3343 domain-containing protein [Serpentinicella sp. ANB-PHB4]|uniref:DUF3343 domain-containing protein n=1 Tax=Serpentinicella sp. ANB-PHB4 TaxID=3074076 RepID=UPI002862A9F1|nr:DUF3343 domain-containing protein [Serpentinicella sp. ANB-PHB4]MDR5658090.1 DUF3343 domain-containing protein [Serpentinicella sp. ANB-PHB4]